MNDANIYIEFYDIILAKIDIVLATYKSLFNFIEERESP